MRTVIKDLRLRSLHRDNKTLLKYMACGKKKNVGTRLQNAVVVSMNSQIA